MSEFDILREVQGNRGRYVIRKDGLESELTYRTEPSGRIIAEHTGVPEEQRGTGVALALVTRLVEDARAEGMRIVPRCSYVEVQRKRHPDWADAFDA